MGLNDVVASHTETASPEVTRRKGVVVMATLPGDREAAGEPWRQLLTQSGHTVHRLGVRAAAIVAAQVAELAPDALVLHVGSRQARKAVQALLTHLPRRGLRTPVLLGGGGVDAAFAQWVAIPEAGTPYWGGVYYCEDGSEVLEVLRQIVLFEPPPPAHVHEAPGSEVQDCSLCGDCPVATSCDLQS
jgi:cobalamin-dependent methionine synthase I